MRYNVVCSFVFLQFLRYCYAQGGLYSSKDFVKRRKANIAELLQLHGFNKFYGLMRRAKLYSALYDNDPYTLFVPSDSVVNNHTADIKDPRDYVEYHIIKGRYDVHSIRDGVILKSYADNNIILNKYYDHVTKSVKVWFYGVLTTVVFTSNETTIFKIDTFVRKPTRTIYQYLQESGNHNMFFEIFKKHRIYFQFPFGSTMLAPLDVAFAALPRKYKDGIFASDVKTRKFIRSHIITRPMCRKRLFPTQGWSRVLNSVGRSLLLYQDLYNADTSFVGGDSVLTSSRLKDGFVYGLTGPILSDVSEKVLDAVVSLDCHTFVQYLIKTGHMATLSSPHQYNTIFAPTDEVFDHLPERIRNRLENDEEFLKTVMMYHVVPGRYFLENFNESNVLETTAVDKRAQNKYKLLVHQGALTSTVQNGIVVQADNLAGNGVVHVINKLLIPSNKTLYEIVQTTRVLKKFERLLRYLNGDILNKTASIDGEFLTIFAPTNNALKRYYRKIGPDFKSRIGAVQNVILRHFLPKPYITAHLSKGQTESLETFASANETHQMVRVHRAMDKDRMVLVSNYGANVTVENMAARNGVLHIVDRLFV